MQDKKKFIDILLYLLETFDNNIDENIIISKNLILQILGKEHFFYTEYDSFYEMYNDIGGGCYNYDVIIRKLKAIVYAVKHSIENNLLQTQEILIAGDILESTLEQAKELLKKKYKDPAAILGRVVVEDALRRLAKNRNISIVNEKGENKRASTLNDDLKKKEVYAQIQWRRVQSWLDLGNDAAHGNFEKILERDVELMIRDIELFIEDYFGNNGITQIESDDFF